MMAVSSAKPADRFGYIWLLLLFVGAITLYPYLAATKTPPEVHNGVLDLRSWNAERDGPIDLSGNWEFYWRQLLEPGQFAGQEHQLAEVPAYWTDYPGDLPATGYATFRLQLKLPPGHGPLALYHPGAGSAYAIWANGQRLGGVGEVHEVAEQVVPARYRRSYFLAAAGSDLELVVQVANANHRKAGFRNSLVLGSAEQIHQWTRFSWIGDAFVLGLILAFAFQYLVLYFFSREDKSSLFFSLLCFVVAIRGGFTSQGLLAWLLSPVPWTWHLRMEYWAFFLAVPLYSSFMRALYPQEYSLVLIRVLWWVAGLFCLVNLFLPTLWMSYLVVPFQILDLVAVLALTYCMVKVMLRKRPYWLYITTASMLVAIVNVLEAFGLAGLLPYGNLSHIGFLAFLLVQAVMLSARSADKERRLGELSANLEERNLSLQHSERKYRALFEDSQDVIFVADLDGNVLDVSPSCEILLGYTRAEIIVTHGLQNVGAEEERRRLFQKVAELGSIVDYQTEIVARDGTTVPVSVTASRRFDENGVQIGFQGYVRDLSDRVAAEEQRQRADQLETLATIDPLTRTFNRRYFQAAAAREIARCERHHAPLSMILFDIDYFKMINDSHGHVTGDKVLNAIARLVGSRIRSSDMLARYGGEEFVVLLPDTILSQAHLRAEELRQLVEGCRVESHSGEQVQLTMSLGVAQWQKDEPLTAFLDRADKALYASKQNGRNRVTVDLASDVAIASAE